MTTGERDVGGESASFTQADLEKSRKNEERFAAANAQIQEKAESLEMDGTPVPFLCECSDLGCTEIIRLSLADYGAARAHTGAFILVSGHDDERVERVIAQDDGYVLVAKFRSPRAT